MVKSHTSMEKGLKKVRKARTIVMIMLVVVAMAIILVDRTPNNNQQKQANVDPTGEESQNFLTSENSQTKEEDPLDERITLMVDELRKQEEVTEQQQNNDPLLANDNTSSQESQVEQQNNTDWFSSTLPPSDSGVAQQEQQKPQASQSSSTSSPQQANGDNKYTIKRGDTLGKIARKHYGKAHLWRIIKKANPGVNPKRLRPGDVIIVPPRADSNTTTAQRSQRSSSSHSQVAQASSSSSSRSNKSYHEIQRGETLSELAKRFNVPVYLLYEKNRRVLKSPHILQPGTKIKIPSMASRRGR